MAGRHDVLIAFWTPDGNPGAAELEVYPDVESFYRAHPAAGTSGESDYGVWWRDGQGGTWRISWVHETGHVYAVRSQAKLAPTLRVAGPLNIGVSPIAELVVVLGNVGSRQHEDHEPLEEILPGWAERCGEVGSLAWAIGRIREAVAVREDAAAEARS